MLGAGRGGKNFRVLVWIPLETDPEARIQRQVIYPERHLQRQEWWNGEGRQIIKGVIKMLTEIKTHNMRAVSFSISWGLTEHWSLREGCPGGSDSKDPPAMWETQVRSLSG